MWAEPWTRSQLAPVPSLSVTFSVALDKSFLFSMLLCPFLPWEREGQVASTLYKMKDAQGPLLLKWPPYL